MLPKAEQVLQTSIQPYISSILEALMEPTSRGFSEVRDVFFKELVELSKNSLNGGGKEKLGEVSHVSLSANFYTLLRTLTINCFKTSLFWGLQQGEHFHNYQTKYVREGNAYS